MLYSILWVLLKILRTSSAAVRSHRNTIDVRGLRVHEAESVVEEKLRNTPSPLWVVHGIGSGRLKKGLIKWLEGLEYVDKVTSADHHDGGDGCSVVWLKWFISIWKNQKTSLFINIVGIYNYFLKNENII